MHPNSDVNLLVVVSEVGKVVEAAQELCDLLKRQPAYYAVQMTAIKQVYRLTCINIVFECPALLTRRKLKLVCRLKYRMKGMTRLQIL